MFESFSYDDDTNSIEIQFPSGSNLTILCSFVENDLHTTLISFSKLEWLKDNEPSTYAKLILNGTMQDYLNSINKSHNELENSIKISYPKNLMKVPLQ